MSDYDSDIERRIRALEVKIEQIEDYNAKLRDLTKDVSDLRCSVSWLKGRIADMPPPWQWLLINFVMIIVIMCWCFALFGLGLTH